MAHIANAVSFNMYVLIEAKLGYADRRYGTQPFVNSTCFTVNESSSEMTRFESNVLKTKISESLPQPGEKGDNYYQNTSVLKSACS